VTIVGVGSSDNYIFKGDDDMKYKIGDKVRVRKDLVVDRVYGEDKFIAPMEKYLDKTMTVDKIVKNCKYKLKEDTEHWNWTDEMLEEDGINIIVDGNKVIAKRDGKAGIAKCSPEDEFDIFTGARLALERLEKECNPYSWLKDGMSYYRPDINTNTMYTYVTYYNDAIDKRFMSHGLVFKTREEAIECAKKMLEVVK
jgi:hypothetical protein